MKVIIRDALIFTQNRKRGVIVDDILIKNGRIEKIGKNPEDKGLEIIIRGKIVLPGIINTHFHLGESIYHKLVHPRTTEEYISLTECIWKSIRHKWGIRKIIVDYSLLHLIKNGITCFVSARSWKETERSGLRAFLGYPLMLSPKLKKYVYLFERQFRHIRRKYHNKKIKVGFWVHSLNFINSEILEMISRWFEKLNDTFFTIHINETKNERLLILEKYGKEPIEVLDMFDLLKENTLLVHCNYLSKKEIKIIKKRRAKISLCPLSALTFNNNLPPILTLMKEKIPFSLSSDNLSSSKTFNLLKVCKSVFNLYKGSINFQKLIDLVTIDAATCLNMKTSIGSIEEGKFADLIIFDNPNKLENREEIVEWLIKKCPAPSDILVGGNFLMRNKKVLTLKENEITNKYKKVVWYVRKNFKKYSS